MGPWREGPSHSRAYCSRAEAIQLPTWICRAVRREGSQPWSVCRGSVRVPALQAPRRPRRACYGVVRFIMENGALGCEVIVSGKVRGQRAKSMKFSDGYMIAAGDPKRDFIDSAVRHVLLRQGCLGIKVKIMLPHDPTGKAGSKTPMPDKVDVFEPKEDVIVAPTKDAAAAY